ncbi:hypothetical protein Tco_0365128 [Tanacetum coccineum]
MQKLKTKNKNLHDISSPKEVNAVGQHVNTASPEVNIGHFKLNTVDPSSYTVKAIHVEFSSDKMKQKVDLGNLP